MFVIVLWEVDVCSGQFSILGRAYSLQSLCISAPPEAIVPPRGHLTMSEEVFDCHNWEILLPSSG